LLYGIIMINAQLLASIKATGYPAPERRSGERAICRVNALLSLGSRPPIRARTLDLSSAGIGLLLPRALDIGTVGEVRFVICINGSLREVAGKVEVTNCVFLSHDVRVGCRFLQLDHASKKAMADFASTVAY
jgi:c-di-GMP-binding flagellar brake protein YcgR